MAILSATPVECMCGQSICTADEKYCSYTPSGAIGTVGQCNVGVFSVLHIVGNATILDQIVG
jgi:hypothetical protein